MPVRLEGMLVQGSSIARIEEESRGEYGPHLGQDFEKVAALLPGSKNTEKTEYYKQEIRKKLESSEDVNKREYLAAVKAQKKEKSG